MLLPATSTQAPEIWTILQDVIEQRRKDGSTQWQSGYPNPQTVADDIAKGWGYVLMEGEAILAYAAIIFEEELAYNQIEGQWLTNGPYVVVHRVAASHLAKGKGVATQLFKMIEQLAISQGVYSIKVDTNYDNVPMLKIMERLGYTYCGEVFFHNAPRKAFEKVLSAAG